MIFPEMLDTFLSCQTTDSAACYQYETGEMCIEFFYKQLIPPAKEDFGQGNVFRPVCHSVHRVEVVCPPPSL